MLVILANDCDKKNVLYNVWKRDFISDYIVIFRETKNKEVKIKSGSSF